MPELTLSATNGRTKVLGDNTVLGRQFVVEAFGIEDRCISREHCQLRWRGRNFWIRDGSAAGTNSLLGTVVDGALIPTGRWVPLPKNALIKLGETTFQSRYEAVYSSEFDLMISYSRKDEGPVLEVFQKIQDLGLRPWLDQKTQTEHHYKKGIEEIILTVPAVIIFWGGDRMGNTQAAEVEVATNLYIHKQIQMLFLVVLPGSEDPDFGQFLSNIDWYDLRKEGELRRLLTDLERKLLPHGEASPAVT
jgi:hypothetical protein